MHDTGLLNLIGLVSRDYLACVCKDFTCRLVDDGSGKFVTHESVGDGELLVVLIATYS